MHVDDSTISDILRRSDGLDHSLFAVGIEILPHELIGVVTDLDANKLSTRRWHLANMDVDTVVNNIADLARYLTMSIGLDLPNPRVCVGIQIGGPVDTATGVVLFYSNNPTDPAIPKREEVYQWENVPLADLVQDATGCATVLANDANAYAAFEQKHGVGQRTGSFAVVLIRDGVGAGIVIDHQLLTVPMELGHFQVWPNGRVCDCGNRGCIDSYAGPRAIRAVVQERTGVASIGGIERAAELANGTGDQADRALGAFREAGEALARGIATVLTLLGPSQIVVYGPHLLVGSGEQSPAAVSFMDELRKFGEYAYRVVRQCELVTEPLDAEHRDQLDHGAHGAALIALNRHFLVPLQSRLGRSR